ncbi:E3 SUMO-protein ligase ZBED1-like [Rana temporaria]|uniref:E3 SUMO-protein ligase ZBED1-like n=1 Tax=Rana temporaria TaxID=8407 RepID=UPI001AADF6F7|nr:E3 SUMO-protein ligase ZBED1-like [Rana temporaria]
MASNESNVAVKHLGGKLSKHFIFKLNADGKVEDGNKVYCIHCNKQLAFRGSNTSLTYHLQHKHPLKYQHVVNSDRQKSSPVQPISNFMSQSNKPVSAKVSADLKIAIAQWIASSGRPTAIVDDDGLQTVLRIALQNQTYNLPSRRTIDAVIGQMYNEKLTQHKKAIESIHSIALTTDFWTSNNNESYCGITGHWIDFDWKLTSVALGCLLVDERHTAENVAGFYKEFAATWNISDKICCIITDNARNMVAAIGQTDFSHIPCIAHCLQLSILAGLKAADSSPLVAKCRHLVGHFKHSSANTSELKSSHSSVSSSKDVMFHKLQQDVATRWNSTYIMLARLLEVKDAVMQYHMDHPKNYSGPKLTESDWDKMAKYTSVLGSLADATEYVGGEQYATCSAVLPLLAFLRRLLRINDDDPGYIGRFKTATLNDFSNRIEGIDALTMLQMAVALDPRYKKLTCLRREKREEVWTTLSNAFRAFHDRRQPAGCPTGLEESNDGTKVKVVPVPKKQKLTLLLSDSESQSSADKSDAEHSAQAELMRYQVEDPIPETEDPLLWWKLNSHRFPGLSRFVQTILCVPATSVPCERLFSSSGYIVNKMRSSLLPENVNTLISVCKALDPSQDAKLVSGTVVCLLELVQCL